MRRLLTLTLLIGAFASAGCETVANVPAAEPAPAADFAFSLEFGACGTDVLDTFAHTFTKDMLGEPPVTISLTLTDSEMMTIYQKMAAINVFGYPAQYDPALPADGVHGTVTPAMHYHFTVRNGGRTKRVVWTDYIVPPPTEEARRLQELAHLMTQIVRARPEVSGLPQPKAGCL